MTRPHTGEQKRITKLWRKHGWGRLYWRSHHSHWRNWEHGAVAVVIDAPARTWYMSYTALCEELDMLIGQDARR